MSEMVPVSMDLDSQKPIPSAWRATLSEIVEALKAGDSGLKRGIPGVQLISDDDASRIQSNIKRYGARLLSLPEQAWQTSACQWMGGYWDVLVDLFTEEEGASDLALSVRVYEKNRNEYLFDVQSVHVP